MRFAVRAGCLALVLIVDVSRLLVVPGLESCPLLFVALITVFALRADALAGGAWGFASGLSLDLLYADSSFGARALGGLLAGSLPVTMKRLLFWRRWTGQAVLSVLAALLFEGTLLAVGWWRGELAGLAGLALPGVVVSAALTGLVCPALSWLMSRLERQH